MTPLSRRDFIAAGVAAGAGLVVGFYLPHGSNGKGEGGFAPNAYLRITPDDKVTIIVARSEMGQGVRTALPMILAEELEVGLDQITIEQAGASRLYGDQTTGGSASIRTTWDPMRKAGASAREMLISAAALDWGVPRSECTAEKGSIVHAKSNRKQSYGKLVDRASTLAVPTDPPLKAAKDYKLVGTRVPRLDTESKVTGKAEYGIDFRLPNMKYAMLSRCTICGGRGAGRESARIRILLRQDRGGTRYDRVDDFCHLARGHRDQDRGNRSLPPQPRRQRSRCAAGYLCSAQSHLFIQGLRDRHGSRQRVFLACAWTHDWARSKPAHGSQPPGLKRRG